MSEEMSVGIKVTLDAKQAETSAKGITKSVEGIGEAADGKHEITLDGGQAIATAHEVAENLEYIEAAASSAPTITLDGQQAATEAAKVEKGIENIGTTAFRTGRKAQDAMHSISDQLKSLEGLAATVGAAGLGLSGFGDFIKLADEYGQMASRIKMATDSAAEYEAVQARLLETASNTYRPLSEAQEMYIRTSDSLKTLGYSTQQALDISGSLSYLMVTNAASSERAAAATQAYSIALQKGEVDALQWKTILAATPTIVDKISAATGKAKEEIRRMGAEGKLSLEALNEGLRASFQQNMEDAAKMPVTVADAFTKLRTSLQAYLGEANEAHGATGMLAAGIGLLAQNVGVLVNVGLSGFVAALSYAASRMVQAAAATYKLFAAKKAAALVERDAALAALRTAQAEMTVVNAEVARLRSNTALAASSTQLATAEARQTAAATTLAAAQKRMGVAATAAAGGFRALIGFLGGPLSIAVGLGAAALAFLSFRNAAEEVKSKLGELDEPMDALIEKFKVMSRTAQAAELGNIKNEFDEVMKSAWKLEQKLSGSVDAEANGYFHKLFAGRSKEAQAEMAAIAQAMTGDALRNGTDELARMIENALHIPDDIKAQWIQQLGMIDELHKKAGELNNRRNAFTTEQKEGDKLAAASDAAANLAQNLKRAQDAAKALGVDLSQFSNTVSPEFTEVEDNLDKLIEGFEKLKSSGIDAGAALNDALTKALDKAKNPADLLALTERIGALGEAGKLAKPKMLDLFAAIKDKARDAGGEAKKLQDEIGALIDQANAIRSGGGSLANSIRDAKSRQGKTPEQIEAENLKRAKQATDDAAYYAAAAKAAQLDGRGKEAAEYAKKAEQSLKAANDAASKLSEEAKTGLDADKLDEAEASLLEQKAAEKQAQLAEMQAATEAQKQQLDELETRIDELIGKATTGATLNVDTTQARPAVDAIKAGIDAIPTEKTVTINIVENRQTSGGQSPDVPGFASGGLLPGHSPHDRADNILFAGTAGEYILPRHIVKQPGMLEYLERLRRMGLAGIRGYADGGLLSKAARAQPLPRAEHSEDAREMVPAVFNIPNVGRVPVNMAGNVAADLTRALARENLMRERR